MPVPSRVFLLILTLVLTSPAFAFETGRIDLLSRKPDGSQFEAVFDQVFAANGRTVYLSVQEQQSYYGWLLDLVSGEQSTIPRRSSLPDLGGDGAQLYSELGALDILDTNNMIDIYRFAPSPELVSLGDEGQVGDNHAAKMNSDLSGQRILFKSASTNLVDGTVTSGQQLHLRNLTTATTTWLNRTEGGCPATVYAGAIDPTGEHVAIINTSRNTVYIWHEATTHCSILLIQGAIPFNISTVELSRNARYALISGATSRGQALWIETETLLTRDPCVTPVGESRDCQDLRLSQDGRYVAFVSSQADLVVDDTNEAGDVFVTDMFANQTVIASRPLVGAQELGKSSSYPTRWGVDNTFLFFSNSNTLVPGDTNNHRDSFRWFPDAVTTQGFDTVD